MGAAVDGRLYVIGVPSIFKQLYLGNHNSV
jgi:hypothetical protein